MSAPEPLTVNVPPDSDPLPACTTAPTSDCDHGDGRVPPPDPVDVTATCSNSACSMKSVLWLVTTRPTSALPASAAEPKDVQLAPSCEIAAVTVEPDRVSLSQGLPVTDAPPRKVVLPPDADRVMNSTPPSGLTSSNTCAESGDVDCRIITPAFAYGEAVRLIPSSCATIDPSPARGCETNWNASEVPQMSAPAPATKNAPPEYDEAPPVPTFPTSLAVHCEGTV